jgi:L-aspartate oxidase
LRCTLRTIAALEGALPPGEGPARDRLTVARLIATAALVRPESRGAHFRSDRPGTDPAWRRRLVLERRDGVLRLETEAVGTRRRERAVEVPA